MGLKKLWGKLHPSLGGLLTAVGIVYLGNDTGRTSLFWIGVVAVIAFMIDMALTDAK